MGRVTRSGFLKKSSGFRVVFRPLLKEGPEEVGVSNSVLSPVAFPFKQEKLVKATRDFHFSRLDGLARRDVQQRTAYIKGVVVRGRKGAVIFDHKP